ncbi:MAG: GIY-YIG nuclease family protein [Pseudomonadota bacterium]
MGFVYILASQPRGTLYIGVTGDLVKRVFEHWMKTVDGFTKRYGIGTLVYFEQFEDISAAIAREKQLKKYKRDWKISLIEQHNPHWHDVYPSIAAP